MGMVVGTRRKRLHERSCTTYSRHFPKCVPYSFCCFWTVNLSSLINNTSASGVSQIVLSTPVHCHDDGNMRREAMCAVPSLSHESRSRIHWRIEYQQEFRPSAVLLCRQFFHGQTSSDGPRTGARAAPGPQGRSLAGASCKILSLQK